VGVSLVSTGNGIFLKPISELLHELLHLSATEAQACSAKGEGDIRGSFVLTQCPLSSPSGCCMFFQTVLCIVLEYSSFLRSVNR